MCLFFMCSEDIWSECPTCIAVGKINKLELPALCAECLSEMLYRGYKAEFEKELDRESWDH